jgi:hypothetical protein
VKSPEIGKGRRVGSWVRAASAALALGAVAGCAMLPEGGVTPTSKRLIVNVMMAGEINPNFVYIVAFRPSTNANPTTSGPVPVVAAPWGNGFVAGNCTYFVRWDPLQSPRYIVYKFTDDTMNAFFQTGVPVVYTDVGTGGKSLHFELDLTQLANSLADAQLLQSCQINFLTMDRVPQGTTGGSKAWDALGDSRLPSEINSYISVDLRGAGIYNNARYGGLEPEGDAPDPALDITEFSVEVRTQ